MQNSFLPNKQTKKNPEHEKNLVLTIQQQAPGHKKAFRELQKMYQKPIEKMITQSLPKSGDVSKAQLFAVASNQFPHIIQKYDPSKGVDVFNWVNTNLRAHLANTVKEDLTGVSVPRGERDALHRYTQALKQARLHYGIKRPSDQQIFEFYPKGYLMSDMQRAKKYYRSDLVGDSIVAKDDEGNGVTLNDLYTGKQTFTSNDLVYDAKSQQLINLMKIKMLPQEFRILEDHIIKGENMAKTALKHGVSTTKVRAVIEKWYAIAQNEHLDW